MVVATICTSLRYIVSQLDTAQPRRRSARCRRKSSGRREEHISIQGECFLALRKTSTKEFHELPMFVRTRIRALRNACRRLNGFCRLLKCDKSRMRADFTSIGYVNVQRRAPVRATVFASHIMPFLAYNGGCA
jgi:hypothetical protein